MNTDGKDQEGKYLEIEDEEILIFMVHKWHISGLVFVLE